MTAPQAGRDGHGTPELDVGDEVAKLAEALQGWWTARSPRTDEQHPDQQHPDQQHPDQHGASCRACPLCRAMDLARSVRPELLLQVASAAETVAVLLREAVAGDGQAPGHDGRSDHPGESDGDRVDPTPIEVTDDDQGGDAAWV